MPINKVGLTTGDFAPTLRDLPHCLDWFETQGAESVELSMPAFGVIAGAKILPHRLEELKNICEGRPFAFTVHGPISSNFMDPDHLQLQIDVCKATMEVCAEISADVQVHHSGSGPMGDEAEFQRRLELEREALAQVAPHAQSCGVILGVETLFSTETGRFATPVELAAQLKAVDHPNIRATIDFSHAAINASVLGYDLMAQLEALAPLTAHLHIHDSFGRPRSFHPYTYGEAVNFGLGDLHLPPGWGVLDWDAIARLPYGANVTANLELGTRYTEEISASVQLCNEMIQRSQNNAALQ